MKKTMRRDRGDDSLSFLEYFLLAVLVIAAAIAGMTFLGSADGQHGRPPSPTTNSHRLRVADARGAQPRSSIHRTSSSSGLLSPYSFSGAGRIES
jgi:hypothetical protein